MVMSAFEKKDPGKFTVRFNIADPQQKAVIDLLNQQGRYKAQFLTSAILHYVHCPETPDIRSAAAVDSTEIERIVRHVLAQQQTATPSALRQGGQEPGEAVIPWSQTVHCPSRAILRKMRTRRLFCKPWTLSVNNKMRHDGLEIQLVMHHSSLSATAVMKLLIISPRQQCCSGDSWDIFWFRAEKSIGGVFPNSK